jgi:F-type H+-transporting ATPase subunit gamma
MKMVAAAKLKKSQDLVLSLRPYAQKLHSLLLDIARSLEDGNVQSDFMRPIPDTGAKVLLVVITSNKGLCGAFNMNIIKKTKEVIQTRYPETHRNEELFLYTLGRKGTEFFSKQSYQIYHSDDEILDNPTYNKVQKIITRLMDGYLNQEFDKIEIIYNKFKNAAVQILTVEQFLPVKLELDEQEEMNHHDYIFEPSKKYIVQELIPKSLRTQFYEAVLESQAAEHGARMTAMHMATDNATELVKDLRLKYNKARQAAITTEISEVVSGAEALNK